MKPILVCLVVLFLLVLPWPANTKQQENAPGYTFDSGNAFLQTCKFDKIDTASVMCGFYTKGIADGFSMAELQHNTDRTICTRTGLSADQAGRVVRKFIEDNPQLLDLPVMILGYKAFQKAFPCSDSK